jgi:hypothetical protein
VAALQRRLANFEHDLVTLGVQVKIFAAAAYEAVITLSSRVSCNFEHKHRQVFMSLRLEHTSCNAVNGYYQVVKQIVLNYLHQMFYS